MKPPRKKPAVVHSRAEKLRLRRLKRKSGPAALRRKALRVELQRKTEPTS